MNQEEITYEVPKWGIWLLILVFSAMALLMIVSGIKYEKWAAGEPVFFKYVFFAIGFVALAVVYRLISWKKIVFFKANSSGMLFPCPKLKKCDSDYLFVSWCNIRNIKLGVFRGNSKGVSIDLKISRKSRDQYFTKRLFERESEWTTVGFADAFLNKQKTILKLNQMKSQNQGQVFDKNILDKNTDEVNKKRRKESINDFLLFIALALALIFWHFLLDGLGVTSVMYYMIGVVVIIHSPFAYFLYKLIKKSRFRK